MMRLTKKTKLLISFYLIKLQWIKAAPTKLGLTQSTSIEMTVRQIKYLNNIIEHQFVKKITNSMHGFKAVHSEKAILSGIELHHMPKNQYNQSKALTFFEQ